jgi:hypothetical protein
MATASRKLEFGAMVVCGELGGSMAPGFAPLAQAERPRTSSNSAIGTILFWKTELRFTMASPDFIWLHLIKKLPR